MSMQFLEQIINEAAVAYQQDPLRAGVVIAHLNNGYYGSVARYPEREEKVIVCSTAGHSTLPQCVLGLFVAWNGRAQTDQEITNLKHISRGKSQAAAKQVQTWTDEVNKQKEEERRRHENHLAGIARTNFISAIPFCPFCEQRCDRVVPVPNPHDFKGDPCTPNVFPSVKNKDALKLPFDPILHPSRFELIELE